MDVSFDLINLGWTLVEESFFDEKSILKFLLSESS
jgi:hypothetical protein